jgi:hypothetical protein
VSNARTQQPIGRTHSRVVDKDSRRIFPAVEISHSSTQALGIARVGQVGREVRLSAFNCYPSGTVVSSQLGVIVDENDILRDYGEAYATRGATHMGSLQRQRHDS